MLSLFCVRLFVVCLLFCVCFSLLLFFLAPSFFLLGFRWKPSLFYFFFRGRWIFQFCIFSLFMCSLFFPGLFDVSVDSLSFRLDELTNADARGLACTCTHNMLTLCLFIPEASICKLTFLSFCQSILCAAPPTPAHIFVNAMLTWKGYLHKQLVSSLCASLCTFLLIVRVSIYIYLKHIYIK